MNNIVVETMWQHSDFAVNFLWWLLLGNCSVRKELKNVFLSSKAMNITKYLLQPWISVIPPKSIYTYTCKYMECELVPYSGKFSQGPNFHDPWPKRENKNRKLQKFEHVNFWKFLPRAFCALVLLDLTSDDGTIALFQTSRRRPTLSHGTSFVLC